MTFYAFLGVLSAVITGLAVVKLLQGILWMIQGRGQIKVYWVHLVWIGFAIFGAFVHYWNIGNLRNNMSGESWLGVADMLWVPMFSYILAGLLFPQSGEDRPVDLRDFYYENHAWIFGAFAIVIVTSAGNLYAIVNHTLELDTLRLYVLVLMFGALAVTRNKWYHMVNAIIFPLVIILSLLLN
jgi:hypothetical protein